MSLPTAIVLSTAIACFTVLAVVAAAFAWAARHPR